MNRAQIKESMSAICLRLRDVPKEELTRQERFFLRQSKCFTSLLLKHLIKSMPPESRVKPNKQKLLQAYAACAWQPHGLVKIDDLKNKLGWGSYSTFYRLLRNEPGIKVLRKGVVLN